jgi:hypothetical protein
VITGSFLPPSGNVLARENASSGLPAMSAIRQDIRRCAGAVMPVRRFQFVGAVVFSALEFSCRK